MAPCNAAARAYTAIDAPEQPSRCCYSGAPAHGVRSWPDSTMQSFKHMPPIGEIALMAHQFCRSDLRLDTACMRITTQPPTQQQFEGLTPCIATPCNPDGSTHSSFNHASPIQPVDTCCTHIHHAAPSHSPCMLCPFLVAPPKKSRLLTSTPLWWHSSGPWGLASKHRAAIA